MILNRIVIFVERGIGATYLEQFLIVSEFLHTMKCKILKTILFLSNYDFPKKSTAEFNIKASNA